jgi:predicted PurR-regulated permease PerM
MIEIIVIASFFIIIAALLYLIYLGNKNNPMSISATEDIMKINNMKQTSVEWLEEQFEESYSYINEIFKETIEQAKAMHREEIINSFFEGAYGGDNISGEQYYNETFNKIQTI